MKKIIADTVANHRARPAISGSPGALRYGQGFYASCSCGHIGFGHGRGPAARGAAQNDADDHVSEEIMKAIGTITVG